MWKTVCYCSNIWKLYYYLRFFSHFLDLFQFFFLPKSSTTNLPPEIFLHCWHSGNRCSVCMDWADTRWCSLASSAVLKGVKQELSLRCGTAAPFLLCLLSWGWAPVITDSCTEAITFCCSVTDNDLVFYLLRESRVLEMMSMWNRGKGSFYICQARKLSVL